MSETTTSGAVWAISHSL